MLTKILICIVVLQLCAAAHIHHRQHEAATARIIGGKEATAHSAPYMVYYEVNPHDPNHPNAVNTCDGTLISPMHVLTAAHCLKGNSTVNFLLVGAHNIERKEPTQQRVQAANFLIHKGYNKPIYINDIAVIKLKSAVTINKNVAVVKLATSQDDNKSYVGQKTTAYGWGYIHDEPRQVETEQLYIVDLKIISNADCLKKAVHKDVYQGDICTDGTQKKGTCMGDSGGPLMLKDVQIGVISRGVSSYCERSEPSIYTRISSYAKWIQDAMKNL